jgi:PHP family Zn ribbon phosphoesterase
LGKCKYSEYTCHKCGVKGHLNNVCKNKKTVKCVEAESESSNSDEDNVDFLSIYTTIDDKQNPFKVLLKAANKMVTMELDTGASVSVVTYEHYKKYFADIELCKTEVKLYTFSGAQLKVVGKIVVPVEYIMI